MAARAAFSSAEAGSSALVMLSSVASARVAAGVPVVVLGVEDAGEAGLAVALLGVALAVAGVAPAGVAPAGAAAA